jgi:hypothetical protein
MAVTEVVLGAVVVVARQVTALAALWIRLSMQLRAEQLRRETLLMLTNRHPPTGHDPDQLEDAMHLGLRDFPTRYPGSGHE